MSIVNQFLSEVSLYLRSPNKQDILDELQSTIQEQIDDRTELMNRPLSDEETCDLLKGYGHPFKVAAEYTEQRYLIGPGLFPYFVYILKNSLVVIFALHILFAIVSSWLSDEFSIGLFSLLFQILESFFYVTFGIIIVFMVMESSGNQLKIFESFDPRTLLLKKSLPVDRDDLITDIITETVAFLWWVNIIKLPNSITLSDTEYVIKLSDFWSPLFWPIAIILATAITLHLWLLLSNQWKKPWVSLEIILDFASIGILVYLVRQSGFVDVNAQFEKLQEVAYSIDNAVLFTLWFILLVSLYETYKHVKLALKLK